MAPDGKGTGDKIAFTVLVFFVAAVLAALADSTQLYDRFWPPQTSTEAGQVEEVEEVPQPELATAPAPSADAPSPASAPAATPSPEVATPSLTPVITSFEVDTVVATPAVPCCMVGPGLFQLGKRTTVDVSYIWTAWRSDGTALRQPQCAMLVTVRGPEDPPPLRTQDCSVRRSNGFTGYGNIAVLSSPGTYTVTAVDEVSGLSASAQFDVIP